MTRDRRTEQHCGAKVPTGMPGAGGRRTVQGDMRRTQARYAAPQPAAQPYGVYVPGQGYVPRTYPGAVSGGPAVAMPGAAASGPTPQKKRHRGVWVAVGITIVCAALAAVLAFTMLSTPKGARSGQIGQLEGKTAEEVQAELDRQVAEGMFNISIASTVEMADGASPAALRIENVPGNRYLMRVEITDDATGQQLYATDYIEPNHHIQTDTLDVDLDAGTYECTATFFAYDMQTEDEVGQAAAKMTIQVLA